MIRSFNFERTMICLHILSVDPRRFWNLSQLVECWYMHFRITTWWSATDGHNSILLRKTGVLEIIHKNKNVPCSGMSSLTWARIDQMVMLCLWLALIIFRALPIILSTTSDFVSGWIPNRLSRSQEHSSVFLTNQLSFLKKLSTCSGNGLM